MFNKNVKIVPTKVLKNLAALFLLLNIIESLIIHAKLHFFCECVSLIASDILNNYKYIS